MTQDSKYLLKFICVVLGRIKPHHAQTAQNLPQYDIKTLGNQRVAKLYVKH